MKPFTARKLHAGLKACLFFTLIDSATICRAALFQQSYWSKTNGGEFGGAVAIAGRTIIVGEWAESSNARGVNGDPGTNNLFAAGAAHIFTRNGSNWIKEAYLKSSNTGFDDEFGMTVAISGDTVVVGAPNEDSSATGVNGNQNDNTGTNSGAVYVFVRSGTNWVQQAYLKASNTGGGPILGTSDGDHFGNSVSISGNTLVVGAYAEASNATGVNGNQNDNSALRAGAAYVFVREGTNWTQQAYLKASNTETRDFFGLSVAISGDTIVVGGPLESSSATGVNGPQNNNAVPKAGAAYVFVRQGTNWSQQAYLKASNTGIPPGGTEGSLFGWVVAISAHTIAIGAHQEWSHATGVNGNQNDTSAPYAGAAYVFVREGTNWMQQAYLKASNTEAEDLFGHVVAVSGDIIVVGAYQESSNATGINGNQNDNSADDAGAAYVFVRSGTNWTQQAYVKASDTMVEDYFAGAVAVCGETVVIGAEVNKAYVFAGAGNGPRLHLAPHPTSGYTVAFPAVPEVTYELLRATSVSGPWDSRGSMTATAPGLVGFHDTNALPGGAFYRVIQP